MTCRRSRAYASLMRTLENLGREEVLLSPEQATIRFAADSLLFCADIAGDLSARRAYADVEELCEQLVLGGRCAAERARRLGDEVWHCGPGLPSLYAAA
jgi:hypothetical protein